MHVYFHLYLTMDKMKLTNLKQFLHFAWMAGHCVCICIVGEGVISMHFRLLFAQLKNLLRHCDVISRRIQLAAAGPQSPRLLPQIPYSYTLMISEGTVSLLYNMPEGICTCALKRLGMERRAIWIR